MLLHIINHSPLDEESGNHCEFQATLVYILYSKPVRVAQWGPVSKELCKEGNIFGLLIMYSFIDTGKSGYHKSVFIQMLTAFHVSTQRYIDMESVYLMLGIENYYTVKSSAVMRYTISLNSLKHVRRKLSEKVIHYLVLCLGNVRNRFIQMEGS